MPKLYSEQDYLRHSGLPGTSQKDVGRSAFQKDYARLLHSPSFRRLQGKTQLFPGAASDYFRSRLTHSLEVAQIAGGIADVLNTVVPEEYKAEFQIDRDLVQFAAIAHDLGHPPFGHNGEHALDELMLEHGGFEGNAQTLHILASMERKLVKMEAGYTSQFGLDLTYRSLAAVLKYDEVIPAQRGPGTGLVKGYYGDEQDLVRNLKAKLAPQHVGSFKTLECSIMDIADDIAYSTYDLEDSLHAGFVTPLSLLKALVNEDTTIKDEVTRKTNSALQKSDYPLLEEGELLKIAANRLHGVLKGMNSDLKFTGDVEVDEALHAVQAMRINRILSDDCLFRTQYTAERVGQLIQSVELRLDSDSPILSKVKLSREALLQVEIFKHLNYELVIRSPKLAVVQHRGRDIVREIFEAIIQSEGDLLSLHWKNFYKQADENRKWRVVCDYVAGMTDRFAVEFHESLFGDGGNLFSPS